MTLMRKMFDPCGGALARPSGRALFLVDSEPSLTVGLMPHNTTLAPNRPQHYSTNQAAEGPHEKPVDAKLSAATPVATGDACLSGQDRLPVYAWFDRETPDSSRDTRGHRRVEAGTVKRRDVSGWSPKPSRHSKQDFVIRYFGQEAELGIN